MNDADVQHFFTTAGQISEIGMRFFFLWPSRDRVDSASLKITEAASALLHVMKLRLGSINLLSLGFILEFLD